MNVKYIISVYACLTVLFSWGCAHGPTRGQQVILNDFTIDQQYKDAMMQKNVIPGMPLDVVLETWGLPPYGSEIIILKTGAVFSVWKYSRNIQVVFKDLRVVEITKINYADIKTSYHNRTSITQPDDSSSDESSFTPSPAPAKGFLSPYLPPPPYKKDAYGLGIWSDGGGQAFQWKTNDGQSVPFGDVTPNVYGPGTGMDQFGRPVKAVPLH